MDTLLIGKHQQCCVSQLLLTHHTLQLIPCLIDSSSVIAAKVSRIESGNEPVHYKDNSFGILKVVAP